MAAKEKEYQRLPGRGRRRNGFVSVSAKRTRLWLGKDHLLCVDAIWYKEDYKRFYYRDIQAVIIRKSEAGRISNVVFSALALPPLIAALMTSVGWNIFWFILAGIFLTCLLVNTLYGPSCVCHLRTAVQIEELPSLNRVRRARKVLARLRPLIAAAQGELNASEIATQMAELAKPPLATTEIFRSLETNLQPPAADVPPIV